MYTVPVVFALLAYTSSVLTSPVTNDLFENECDGKEENNACMLLDQLSFEVEGVCSDVAVSVPACRSTESSRG